MPIILMFEIITKEFFNGNAGALKRIVILTTRPRSHDKIAQRKDFRKILPRADLTKGIQADDEIKRISWPFARGEGATDRALASWSVRVCAAGSLSG